MKMSEIARLANVSVATVSKAFSGSAEISEDTKNKIFHIAKANNCYLKYNKVSGYNYIIAVICHEFKGGYYTGHLANFEEEISKRGGLMIVACDNFAENERKKLVSSFLANEKIDGIIMYGDFKPDEKIKIPVVSIGASDYFTSVILSNQNAMYEAVLHLKENGHKKIAYIGDPLAMGTFDNYKSAMDKNKIPVNKEYVIKDSGFRFETAGYEAMKKLLELNDPPTAVITAYDYIAFGAMKAINEKGLSVPDDISVIGNNDVRECNYMNMALTTIAHYSTDLCEIVTEELFEEINSGILEKPKKIRISAQLLKRDTVGMVKNN